MAVWGLRQEVGGGGDLAVAEFQRRHDGGVNLGGGDARIAEGLVARGAGIVHDREIVAEVCGGARRRVDAHVAHRADDHHIFDAARPQRLVERRLAEGIRVVLDDDRVVLARRDGRDRLDAFRARREERRGGVRGDVVDMDDPVAPAAPGLDDARGIGGGGIDAGQREAAGGKIVLDRTSVV